MDITNKYCNIGSLRNESDVEQFFLMPLLKDLGYDDTHIVTKMFIQAEQIEKGRKKKLYSPDYVVYRDKRHNDPIIIIDAKNPKENVESGVEDAELYAFMLRKSMKRRDKPKPYCVGCNGISFVVKEYESSEVKFELTFKDFVDGNPEFEQLREVLSYDKIQFSSVKKPSEKQFVFEKPQVSELEGIFRACHNKIWKKEKIKPAEAFYEFSKLFFLKLYNDREIHRKISEKQPISDEDYFFSENYIAIQNKRRIENPFSVLFDNLKKELEKEIKENKKKRIFEPDEKIELKPSTIIEVVKLLEHFDLHGIDEDLNGRMFESFLNATVRGKDLGQFFTPRSVVKFMVKMADISVDKEHVDTVLDGLCGSGGFLIESMAQMFEKVNEKKSLTDEDKKELKQTIVSDSIWGTDANKNMSRVARMNMYLHGDGSNRVYWVPDFLDKELQIEKGIDPDFFDEATEFKNFLKGGKKFKIALTNPPFSMKYNEKEEDERRVLIQYDIAYVDGKDKSDKIRSLKSNVISLERYYDLLEPHGKLITVIDESVLNAGSEKPFREFIRSHFIIKAVISLPKNTFVKAETGVKTSILYLVKKINSDEQQPHIFMAVSENVGHTDSGKPCPEKSDLNSILTEFRKFEGS